MNNRGHTFESSGPEVKVRGTAQQVLEKYLALARDAASAGEHITAEGYFQYAEHYYRILNAESDHHRGHGGQGYGQHQHQNQQQQPQPQQQPAAEPPSQPAYGSAVQPAGSEPPQRGPGPGTDTTPTS